MIPWEQKKYNIIYDKTRTTPLEAVLYINTDELLPECHDDKHRTRNDWIKEATEFAKDHNIIIRAGYYDDSLMLPFSQMMMMSQIRDNMPDLFITNYDAVMFNPYFCFCITDTEDPFGPSVDSPFVYSLRGDRVDHLWRAYMCGEQYLSRMIQNASESEDECKTNQ